MSAESAAKIADMTESGRISGAVAKRLFERCFGENIDPEEVVEAEDLGRIDSAERIENIIREVLAAEPKLLSDYRKGKTASRGAMVGGVMRRTGGRADPKLVNEILDRILVE